MNAVRLAVLLVIAAAMGLPAPATTSQESFRDSTAITQFQRFADAYAMQHRQIQRRLGEGADQAAMAAAIRAARPSAGDGDFFTPIIGDAFRHRISNALRTPSCKIDGPVQSSEVPRVGGLAIGAQAVPSCVVAVLPRLPEELEYRVASVALVLLDTHANAVVDVLHGAFPTMP
jgi:hypothetical protein